MRSILTVLLATVTIVSSTVGTLAAEFENFTGTAARSGTFKRPLLDMNGTRYELQAADTAGQTVADLLKKFSEGDTGRYVITGTRATVKGKVGIVIENIAPANRPEPRPKTTQAPTKPIPPTAPSTATSTSPQVTMSVVTVGDDRYTVYDYDDLIARRCSFVIPEGMKTVRGLLVHGCYSGGDSRNDWKDCEYYRQFMHLHGFAYVGNTFAAGPLFGKLPQPADTSTMARHRAIYDSFVDSVKSVAAAAQHPEMVHAPYVGVGFSAGGGNALNLMCFAPEKTIAAASYCAPYLFKRRITGTPSDELLHVPAIAITGEQEGFNIPLPADVDPATGPAKIDEVFIPYRPKGATYAWLERQAQGHSYFENRQDVLGMPFLDAAVRARYPQDGDVTNGPIKLLAIDSATGWIADNTSRKSGLTKIVPASEFNGDLGHSSWLMNEDLAFIYRAYSTYDNPLRITSPGSCWPTMPALEPGADVPITVDASQFRDWKTIAFYDGAKKLGEVNAGAPPRFTATDLTPGYHVFSILATDSGGDVRTADPKLVIVKPAEITGTADASHHSKGASAGGVTIVRSFPGNKGPGWKQTIDVAGAVGPDHVVDFDVASFVVHDKQTGKVVKRLSPVDFWKQVEPAGSLVPDPIANDARMLYDRLSQRWFACAAVAPDADCFLAVSTTANPLDPWRGTKLPLPHINPYMKMGVDQNGLYVTSCNGHAEPLKAMNLYVIPKSDVLAPGGPILTNATNFPTLQFSSMPATDADPDKPADAPAVLLTNEFSGGVCDRLYLYRVTWSGLKASLSDVQIVPLKNAWLTANNRSGLMEAAQPDPGPNLHAGGGGRRLDSVVTHKGSVFGCNGAKRNAESRLGVLWYEVRISDGKLLQEGFVDSPDRDLIYPSIAVDASGHVGIGCTGTSKTEFPSVYVMMHGANDPPGSMRTPVKAVPGTTAYHYAGKQAVNWSHYSPTSIDPDDPHLFWTLQAYGNSSVDQEWCTAWCAFRLSD